MTLAASVAGKGAEVLPRALVPVGGAAWALRVAEGPALRPGQLYHC